MATTREALETTIALEKESMALYARLAKLFSAQPKLQDFWFGMARDEARHVGALDLVWTVLDLEGKLDAPGPISLEDSAIVRQRDLLARFHREARSGLGIERGLEMSLVVEETERQDLVVDSLKACQ